MTVFLTKAEISELDRQDPVTKSRGGWQSLLVGLQLRVLRSNGQLDLTATDLERISRYAFGYGNGGWESRLRRIFGRSLGTQFNRNHSLSPAA